MATFTGTKADEIITPLELSPTVTSSSGANPGAEADVINAGGGDDTVEGGFGADIISLGGGDDLVTWNPGGGSDLIEGGGGADRMEFIASNVSENLGVQANGGRLRITRDIATVTIDANSIEQLFMRTLGGADNISAEDLSGTGVKSLVIDLQASSGGGDGQIDSVTIHGTAKADIVKVGNVGMNFTISGLPWHAEIRGRETMDNISLLTGGGSDRINLAAISAGAGSIAVNSEGGNDVVTGSVNIDAILLGAGKDKVTSGAGADFVHLGDGNDTFFWKAGDGGDTVDGGLDSDKLRILGAAAAEVVSLNAAGTSVLVASDLAGGVLTGAGLETISYLASKGADTVFVADLAGSGISEVEIDLAGAGKRPDESGDVVTVTNTGAGLSLDINTGKGAAIITGLSQETEIRNGGANDVLVIRGGLGAEIIDASGFRRNPMRLELNGGGGDDTLVGSNGADVVTGGDGQDNAVLGGGNDRFVWAPGDDNDLVDGGKGTDVLDFSTSNVSETIDLSSNSGQFRLFRNVANVTIDGEEIENVFLQVLGGADTITLNDLFGTGIKSVMLDLEGVPGSASSDAQLDVINLSGRTGKDVVSISSQGAAIAVEGLSYDLRIRHADTTDRLVLSGLGGADKLSAEGATANRMVLVLDGGAGNDQLTGGAAADIFRFATALDEAGNIDKIRKFATANDSIELDDTVFVGIGVAGPLAASAFAIGSAATDANHRVIYDDQTGELYYDADGNGAGDAVMFARMAAGLDLAAGNFAVI